MRKGEQLETGREGLGLGLAISKAIIEMHGGTISARSKGIGEGATFTVTLPAAQQRFLQTLPVPQRRWRKRSQGENKILSASKPIMTITSMMPMTWSIALSSRP